MERKERVMSKLEREALVARFMHELQRWVIGRAGKEDPA